MNILKTYIDNVFTSLPNTKEVNKMKEDLLLNMEEKYHELKNSGKTENEAIGIVISEFGNIEELASELGVNIEPKENDVVEVTIDEAKEYLSVTKKMGRLIALGVFLCIVAPALLVLTFENIDSNLFGDLGSIFGIAILLVLVAIGVGLFIYSGVTLEKYKYLKKDFIVSNSVKEYIKIEERKHERNFVVSLIISVTMFILSPVTLIVFSALNDKSGVETYSINLGISILLFLVALGCFLIIKSGMVKDSFNVLLQTGDYSKKKKFPSQKAEKLTGAIAGLYWPLVFIAYLLWSFIGGAWGISWLIWPIAGILFGGIASIINALNDNKG